MPKKSRVGQRSIPRNLVDAFAGLIALLIERAVNLGDITVEELRAMRAAQETERDQDRALSTQYKTGHAQYRVAALARYDRFMEALDMVAGRFRRDPVMLERIELLRRPSRRHKAATPVTTETPPPAAHGSAQ